MEVQTTAEAVAEAPSNSAAASDQAAPELFNQAGLELLQTLSLIHI